MTILYLMSSLVAVPCKPRGWADNVPEHIATQIADFPRSSQASGQDRVHKCGEELPLGQEYQPPPSQGADYELCVIHDAVIGLNLTTIGKCLEGRCRGLTEFNIKTGDQETSATLLENVGGRVGDGVSNTQDIDAAW